MPIATGTFDVKVVPVTRSDEKDSPEGLTALGRLSIDKQFHGDLEGPSKGEMLSAMTPTKGSAGYVAIERADVTLAGKKGTFVFQHSGSMNRGEQSLNVNVVPDSATGELTGLKGSMKIIIEGKLHRYEFEYELPTK